MGLLGISTGLAVGLLGAGILGLASKKVRSIYGATGVLTGKAVSIGALALGILSGGVGATGELLKGKSANISGNSIQPTEMSGSIECAYIGGTAMDNTTIKADSNDFSQAILKIDSANWNASAGSEVNMTFECDYLGDATNAHDVVIYGHGELFSSEINSYDVNKYPLLDVLTSQSRYFAPEKEQIVYLTNGDYATTSDSQERLKVRVGGESYPTSFKVSVLGELSETSIGQMEDDSHKLIQLTTEDGNVVGSVEVIKN